MTRHYDWFWLETKPYLDVYNPGVMRQQIFLTVKNFFHRPPLTETGKISGAVSAVKRNSHLTGFRGEKSRFSAVSLVYKDESKEKADMFLQFQSDCDIKIRAEWSVSVITSTERELAKSTVTVSEFQKWNGEYQLKHPAAKNLNYDLRMLEDPHFARYEDIREKGWLLNGDLRVKVDIVFKVLTESYCRPSIVQPFSFPTDFTIISAGGEEIDTYKRILALQSPVFRAMFENDVEETRTGICRIEDADAESIKAMLAFLVGVEPKKWNFDLAMSLFQLADKYELTILLQRSGRELAKKLTTENFLEVLLLADRHACKPLLNEVFHFMEDKTKKATRDGVPSGLRLKNVPIELFCDWQAHWCRRTTGVL